MTAKVWPQFKSVETKLNWLSTVITKYITACTTRFNPFKRSAKPCRVFLAHFPPDAFKNVKFDTKLLARTSDQPGSLSIKFSTCSGLGGIAVFTV